MESQNRAIKEHLEAGNKITHLEALKLFGCLRLGGRIFDLRQDGLPVKTDLIQVNRKAHSAAFTLINHRNDIERTNQIY